LISNRKLLVFFYTFVLFITGLVVGSLFSGITFKEIMVKPEPTATPTAVPEESSELVEIEDFIYETSLQEGQKWELLSKFMETKEENKLIDVQGVTCNFYEEDKKKLTVISEKGRINTVTKDVSFDTKVTAVADTGETLVVDTLSWKGEEKKVSGEGNVVFTQDNNTVKADKIKGDLNFNTYRLEDNVVLISELGEEENK